MFGICVEASHQRGMGHLFRMLNLCQGLSIRNLPFRIFINKNKAAQKILDQHNFLDLLLERSYFLHFAGAHQLMLEYLRGRDYGRPSVTK